MVFGPLASQVFADYGADVVKVEPPVGDITRQMGPAAKAGMAAAFLANNRKKRSVLLDLKHPDGQRALHALCARADVLMHNIRPQKLHRIGIDGDALRQPNPRLVYAALVGFGEGGPYAGLPAYDDIVQGMSGLTDLVQRQFGEARYLPVIAVDKTGALTVAHAILAALLGRERTGHGCKIEIPLYEANVAMNLVEHLSGWQFDPPLGPTGYSRVLAPWRRPYRALGHICLMPYTDANWRDFFAEVGRSELAADARFATMDMRTRHIGGLLRVAGSSWPRAVWPTGCNAAAAFRLRRRASPRWKTWCTTSTCGTRASSLRWTTRPWAACAFPATRFASMGAAGGPHGPAAGRTHA